MCADLDWCEFGEVLTECWEREMELYFSGDEGRYLPLPFENWFFGPVNNSGSGSDVCGGSVSPLPAKSLTLSRRNDDVFQATGCHITVLSQVFKLGWVEGKANSIFSCLSSAAAAEKEIKQHRDWGSKEMASTVKIKQTQQIEMFGNQLREWKQNILSQRWTEMSMPINNEDR